MTINPIGMIIIVVLFVVATVLDKMGIFGRLLGEDKNRDSKNENNISNEDDKNDDI